MILNPDHPVASALRRKFPDMISVDIDCDFTMIEYKDHFDRCVTAPGLYDALLKYEATGEFVEGDYTFGTVQ